MGGTTVVSPLQGSRMERCPTPRALPWAEVFGPVGAEVSFHRICHFAICHYQFSPTSNSTPSTIHPRRHSAEVRADRAGSALPAVALLSLPLHFNFDPARRRSPTGTSRIAPVHLAPLYFMRSSCYRDNFPADLRAFFGGRPTQVIFRLKTYQESGRNA